MYNPFSLSDKTILVTGASSGIGRATAIECARMGARVVLTARNKEHLQETLLMLEGDEHSIIVADITTQEGIKTISNEAPTLDGVVVSSGMSLLKPLQVTKTNDLETVFGLNTFAPILLVKQLTKAKKLTVGASVVFIASISGYTNIATALGTYGASKSALRTFAQYAALELAGKKIRCNTVSPGRIETELLQNQTMSEEDLQKDIQRYPLKRYGKPEEVAQSCVYLLSDATQWITGTDIIIDGGRSLS